MIQHKAVKSISELKPIHVTKWIKLIENFDEKKYEDLIENLQFRAQVVSIFLEISLNQARRIDVNDLMEISEYYIKLMYSFQYKEPTGSVIINGIEYVAHLNYGAWATGQIIDVKILKADDFFLHPERFLAIMYVEKGMSYCQEDSNQVVQNPNSIREKIFAEYFPGDELWRWYGFFLQNYNIWKLAILGIQIARTKIQTTKMEKELKKTQRQMTWRNGLTSLRQFITFRKTSTSKSRK